MSADESFPAVSSSVARAVIDPENYHDKIINELKCHENKNCNDRLTIFDIINVGSYESCGSLDTEKAKFVANIYRKFGGGNLDEIDIENALKILDFGNGTRGGFKGAKPAVLNANGTDNNNYKKLLDTLRDAQRTDPRIGQTLPGAKNPISVTAESNIGGKNFFDTNQTARPDDQANPQKRTLIHDLVAPNKPNSNMANAHAEIALIQRAYDNKLTTNQDMTIIVRGRAICDYCKVDLVNMAHRAKLNKLTLIEAETGKEYMWNKNSNSLKEIK